MKKTIAVFVVLLLAVSSAQALTVLMDEDFNSAPADVDLDTLPGWVNNAGTGVFTINTSNASVEPVDVGRGISKDLGSTYEWSNYSYAVSNVSLGAGEFYRYESFWDVHDSTDNSNACILTRLVFDNGDHVDMYINPGDDLTQDSYGSPRSRTRIYPGISGDIRVRMDVGPFGVRTWYDNGAGWVQASEALVGDNASLNFTGGVVEVNVQLFAYEEFSLPDADSFSLVVIPEPATLVVLALGGFAVLLRRKR